MQAAKAMATRIPFEIGTTRAVELQLRAHGGEMKISSGAMGWEAWGEWNTSWSPSGAHPRSRNADGFQPTERRKSRREHPAGVAADRIDGYDGTSRSDAVEDGLLGLAGLVILLALAGFGLQELAVELRNAQDHPSTE